MSFYSLTLIALALSLDAFGVAISLGICNIKLRHSLPYIFSFAFFQFLFALAGAYAGFLFNTYIVSVPKIIGGVVIALVGAFMLKEGFEHDGDNKFINKKSACFVLGVSVSIDAMVVGFTALNNIQSNLAIFRDSLYIGFVTLVMTSIAFSICKYLRKIKTITSYADYIGGIILIIFGIKMILF